MISGRDVDNIIFFIISVGFSLLIGNPLIKLLSLLNVKQTIREDGPKEHIQKKSKTPTIGGLIFLIPIFFIVLYFYLLKKEEFQTLDLIVVLGCTFTMAIVGFIDDLFKILKKHNKGVSGWVKLFVQFLISFFLFYKYKEGASLIFLFWYFFIFAGASNSYNLTDGLDGLLGSISLVSFIGFCFLLHYSGSHELVKFLIIFIGSLLGFLYFNKHPAKVFMGDTGSLAIGGAIGALAIVSRSELYLICFATIPILEALSVILQVVSCQLSKRFLRVDKRIFKMAPLHHHFELCGWEETTITKRFFVFQVICVIIGIVLIKLWHEHL